MTVLRKWGNTERRELYITDERWDTGRHWEAEAPGWTHFALSYLQLQENKIIAILFDFFHQNKPPTNSADEQEPQKWKGPLLKWDDQVNKEGGGEQCGRQCG